MRVLHLFHNRSQKYPIMVVSVCDSGMVSRGLKFRTDYRERCALLKTRITLQNAGYFSGGCLQIAYNIKNELA